MTIVPVSANVLPNVAPETPRSMYFGSVLRTRVRAASSVFFGADGGGIVVAAGRSDDTRQPTRPNSSRSPGFSGVACAIWRPLITVGALASVGRTALSPFCVEISQ